MHPSVSKHLQLNTSTHFASITAGKGIASAVTLAFVVAFDCLEVTRLLLGTEEATTISGDGAATGWEGTDDMAARARQGVGVLCGLY